MERRRRGEVQKIGDLFEVYKKKLRAPQQTVVNEAHTLIKELYNFDIPKENIHYSPGSKTLSFNTNSQLKTEIALNKKEVLAHLTARLGEKSAPQEIL